MLFWVTGFCARFLAWMLPPLKQDPATGFAVGTYCYAYHGPLMYKAKVLAVQGEPGTFRYLVHYDKWNKKHDEWVEGDRVLAITPDTTLEFEKLQAGAAALLAKADNNKKRKSAAGEGGSAAGDGAGAAGEAAGAGSKSKASKQRRTDVDNETVRRSLELCFPLCCFLCGLSSSDRGFPSS
jgi:hypothetical protein